MQTFLPYEDFNKSARCLDYRRLGNQRKECKQILQALRKESKGWRNHTATKMWRGYEGALCRYALSICDEWVRRGYRDEMTVYFRKMKKRYKDKDPPWLGNKDLHASHRSQLLAKNYDYYSQFGWNEEAGELLYVWPVK